MKVTDSTETDVLPQLDRLVDERLTKSRLARACELLDPIEEQGFAEVAASADLEEWPEN
jgi:hypothetical protein